jgi:fructan beta-fructosidase
LNKLQSFTKRISNEAGEYILAGFDKNLNEFFVDRTNSGIVDFNKEFGSRSAAPRISNSEKLNLTLVLDQSSIELFADDGLSVMTALFFPKKPFTDMQLLSDEELEIQTIQSQPLRNTLFH